MDFFLKKKEGNRSFFDIFAGSEVIKDLLADIVKTSGLDVALADKNGSILLSSSFFRKSSPDFQEDISKLILEIQPTFTSDNSPLTVQIQSHQKPCFIISPIYSHKWNELPGYLIGGPFMRDQDSKVDCRVEGTSFPYLDKALSENKTQTKPLNFTSTDTVIHLIASYSRVSASLYEEKYQSLKSMERLNSLYRINSSLNRTLDLQEILQMVLDRAIDLLDAKKGSILLMDPGREFLKIFLAHGLPEDIIKNSHVKIGEGIAGWVAKEGKPQLLKKGVKDDRSSVNKAASKLASAISVPMICIDEVVGVLNVSEKSNDRDFTDEEMELLQALADNAANAIRNARLYEKVQRKVEELSALFKLSTAIVSSLNRKEVLQQIMDNAIKLLNASAGSLMILAPEKDEMEIEVAVGLPEKVMSETRIKLGEGIAGKVALEKEPRLLKKGIKEQESKSEEKAVEIPSALCVPMVFRESVIGVLNVKGKPDGSNFGQSDVELLTMLASQAAIAIVNAELHKSLKNLFVNSIKALANAIEARDEYTRGHSERVTEYSVKIAERMNFPAKEIEKIRYAALLHDIGKIKVKEEILNKPGRLTSEEYRIITEHPAFGAKIMSPVPEFREILPYMYHHHEKYASGGYPDGVKGDSIPLAARIIAVADTFDAMTSDRPYRNALSIEVALTEIDKNSGSQFDPLIVKVFDELYEQEKEWLIGVIDSSKILKEEAMAEEGEEVH